MSVYDDYEPPVSEGLYHKFENNHTYQFRIITNPVRYISSFTRGDKTTDRMMYAWLVWNRESKSVQVLKLPGTAFKQILKFARDPEYGDPQGYDLRITRSGESLKTVYDIVASPTKNNLETTDPESTEKALDVDLIEAVGKGQGVSNVAWLQDVATGEGTTEKSENKNTKSAKPKDDNEEPW